MRKWAEYWAFFRQFREQTTTTGAFLPSGRRLARALAGPMGRQGGPRKILEIGPGTGAVTSEIVQLMRPGDSLDIVEINASFVAVLRQRFETQPHFERVKHQAQIIHAPLQDVKGEKVYDFMISGLPLNNFPIPLVHEIFTSYERLLKPEGVLSYFEYVGIRSMKKPFCKRDERQRLTELTAYLQEKIRRHQVGEDLVMLNMPPAYARHLRFGSNLSS